MERRVTGLGGFFFKSANPKKLKNWYHQHLGIDSGQFGWSFLWKDQNDGSQGTTVWNVMDEATDYLNPSKQPFMMNFRVEKLEELLEVLKAEGVQTVGEMESFPYGKFAWIMDPDGNKIELWEPIDSNL